MLAIARRIVEAEKYVEADAWQSWDFIIVR